MLTQQQGVPAHLADWTVLVNEQVRIQVNSLTLVSNSKCFYDLFKLLDQEKGGKQQPKAERLTRVSYGEPGGLQLLLRAIGCCHRPEEQPRASADGGDPWAQLEPEDLGPLVRAALHFQVPRVLDLAMWTALTQTTLSNCWRFWRAAVQSNWPPLKVLVQSAIAAIFLPASALPEFGDLTEAELLGFLRDRQLNIGSELELLEPIERWLESRPGWPQSAVANLLGAVRVACLSPAEAREFEASRLLGRSGQAPPAELLAALSAEQEAAGTQQARIPHEAIFVCGGWEGLQNDPNFGPSDAVQVYNFHERAWARHTQPPGPVLRCGHAYSGCVLLGHCVYIVGGYVQNRATGSQGPTAAVKEYNLRQRAWRPRAPMHHPRNYVSAASLDGFVYAVGGHNGRNRLNTAERYHPADNRWQMIAPLLQVRSDAGCAGLLGRLYVCGGFNGQQFFSSVECYDPGADQWTYVAAMHSVRSGVSVCECDGQLFALGGNNGNSRLASVERFDPELNQWTPMPQMLTQRSNFSAALLRGEIFAIGGWSDQTNTTVSVVEKWRPGANSRWELAPSLLLPASANCCCSVVGLDLMEGLLVPADAPPPPSPPPLPQQQQQIPADQQQIPADQQQQHRMQVEAADFESSSD